MKINIGEVKLFIKHHMPWLLLLIFMVLADVIMLLSIQGPEEFVFKAAPGEMVSISLPFGTVEGIAFSNNDASLDGQPFLEDASIDVGIYDGEKEAAIIHAQNVNIHTNGFSNAESGSYEGLPCVLEKGKEYSVGISSQSVDKSLTIALYGKNKSFGTVLLPVFIGEILILAVLLFKKKFSLRTVTALLMCGIALTAVVLMPALQTGEELSSFADVYSVSSKLMGRPAASAGEMAYISEDGLLNMGYSTYRVPVYRFWADNSYGRKIEGPVESALYVRSQLPVCIFQLPAVIGVSIARLLGLSYKGVLMSGWIFGFVVSFLMVFISVSLLSMDKTQIIQDKRRHMLQELFICISLTPALVFGSFSYTGIGVCVSLIMLLTALLINSQKRALKAVFFVCLIPAFYGIVRFAALVLKTNDISVIGNEAADGLSNGVLKSLIYADRTMVELIAYRNIGYDNPVLPAWIFWIFIAAGVIGIIKKQKNNTILKIERSRSNFFIFAVCSLVLIMFGYFRL